MAQRWWAILSSRSPCSVGPTTRGFRVVPAWRCSPPPYYARVRVAYN
jgi:hypothetical protein